MTARPPLYFISGLGADERVFTWLRIEGYEPVHLPWLRPRRGESIADYARRFGEHIPAREEPIVVGLSFGGLVAVELAKQRRLRRAILLSSAKTAAEIPFYFKLFRWLPLHRVFPFKRLLWAFYWLADWIFSLVDGEQRRLLRAILDDTDPHFLKWALHRVVTWRNQQVPEGVVHIHGSCDRIFPRRWVRADAEVDGGHLVVITQAARISQLIQEALPESVQDQADAAPVG